eukprot:6876811-Prymnesium_polylepis.1
MAARIEGRVRRATREVFVVEVVTIVDGARRATGDEVGSQAGRDQVGGTAALHQAGVGMPTRVEASRRT